MTDQNQIAYWNERARLVPGQWEASLWLDLPDWNRYVDRLQRWHLNQILRYINKKHRVLDIGCGVGRWSIRLAQVAGEVLGIDIAHVAMATAKVPADIQNLCFCCMSADKLALRNNSFDVALSVTSLQCLLSKDRLQQALRELGQVLRPEGILILLEDTTDRRRLPFSLSLMRKEWLQSLTQHGFQLLDWYGIDIPLLRNALLRFFNVIVSRTTRRGMKLCFEHTDKLASSLMAIQNRPKLTWRIESILMRLICLVLTPFEYLIAPLLRYSAMYTVMVARNMNR